MNILVIGATGLTGGAILEQARQRQHTVTVLVRDPSRLATAEHVRVLQGDVRDKDAVEAAVAGQDAVISALGQGGVKASGSTLLATLSRAVVSARQRSTTLFSDAARTVSQSMLNQQVRRYIVLSMGGIGDSKGSGGILFDRLIIPLFLRSAADDHYREEQIIRNTPLAWTLVRPPSLTNAPARGRWRVFDASQEQYRTQRIPRADVASFMLDLAENNSFIGEAPAIEQLPA